MPENTDNTTRTGLRPDLEILEVNAPFGYIGSRIFPEIRVNDKGNSLFYRPTVSAGTAQTSRNQQNGSITRNFFASAYKTYSCAEVIFRSSTPLSEVDSEGGIEGSDLLGGTAAKLGIMAKIETMQAAKLFTGTAHSVTYGGFLSACARGAAAVRKVAGTTALVLPEDVYRAVIMSQEVQSRLAYTGFMFEDPAQVLSVKKEVLLSMLANICQVQEVLIGDVDLWNPTDLTARAAIVKLAPANTPLKLAAQYGRTILNGLGSEGTPFEIRSNFDETFYVNDYTARTFMDIVEFNADGKYILSGFGSWTNWSTVNPTDSSASGSGSASGSAAGSASGSGSAAAGSNAGTGTP